MNYKTFEQRMEDKKRKQSLQLRINELREERIEGKRKFKKQQMDKAARKKINEMRSAKYQVIKDLSRTKKWHKKARHTLQKLPAEIFYEKFK